MRWYMWVCLGAVGGCTHGGPATPTPGRSDTDGAIAALDSDASDSDARDSDGGHQEPPGSVLLIVLDDVGAYDIDSYPFGDAPAATPHIDALAAQGVMFTRAWSQPLCSPSRASILTGLQPIHHGVGDVLHVSPPSFSLPLDIETLPEWLRDHAGYSTGAVGKWHVSDVGIPSGASPLEYGFDTYVGQPTNLSVPQVGGKVLVPSYFHWDEFHDRKLVERTGYLTTAEVDEALEMTTELAPPWFVYVGLHAAHLPLHVPPGAVEPAGGWDGRSRYVAMLEAADTEIGRLIDSVPADTTVIVVGDNGVPKEIVTPGFSQEEVKGTPMEGGIRVPLIIRVPHERQPGAQIDVLAQVADLMPTIADAAQAPTLGALDLDGRSLLPFVLDPSRVDADGAAYSEFFTPGGDVAHATEWERAIRDDRYKILREDGADRCFDLGEDLHEGADLYGGDGADPAAIARCDALVAKLDADEVR